MPWLVTPRSLFSGAEPGAGAPWPLDPGRSTLRSGGQGDIRSGKRRQSPDAGKDQQDVELVQMMTTAP
jgi:hypothetical protein